MVYNEKSHSNWRFRGTPISGNPHSLEGVVSCIEVCASPQGFMYCYGKSLWFAWTPSVRAYPDDDDDDDDDEDDDEDDDQDDADDGVYNLSLCNLLYPQQL